MNKFLVIVDMQNDFIDGSLGTPEARAIVPRIIQHIKDVSNEVNVLFTRDCHEKDYLSTPEGKKLPVEHCICGTEGWEISSDLQDIANRSLIFNKYTFGSVTLMNYLQYANPKEELEIEFCGLCTDICVVSNVLMAKAFFPYAKITVNSQLCAGVTPESHEAALTTMKMCQIDII